MNRSLEEQPLIVKLLSAYTEAIRQRLFDDVLRHSSTHCVYLVESPVNLKLSSEKSCFNHDFSSVSYLIICYLFHIQASDLT